MALAVLAHGQTLDAISRNWTLMLARSLTAMA
jgi:hypothetical protein